MDRAAGVMLGVGVGDALGVPYEFQPLEAVHGPGFTPKMSGGGLGPYEPGEWSDDTQMTLCIAKALANVNGTLSQRDLDAIAWNFLDWEQAGATDIGSQTRRVLEVADASLDLNPDRHVSDIMKDAGRQLHNDTGRTAGNGSLMRTAPVALRYLDDLTTMVEAAVNISKLTHFDDLAADACVIWCNGIRMAVLEGTVEGVLDGVSLIPPVRREFWQAKVSEAAHMPSAKLSPNGYAVTALQAAWSAVTMTPMMIIPFEESFRRAVTSAITIGDDTDTVAAITGALIGGITGASSIPAEWRDAVHGWPGDADAATLMGYGSMLAEMS